MSHHSLECLIHTWLNMLLRISDAYRKCYDLLGSQPDAVTLVQWQNDPAAAFAWLCLHNRKRKHAKIMARAANALCHAAKKEGEVAKVRHQRPPDPVPDPNSQFKLEPEIMA
ncbi:uncharacterized protein CTRU02_215817 [Colletotrichum truncatum]|uniref:Uncharacterized protein n=1 Tax=Colletotrichum truncatum TaxID=5467 RepID=A0ACC3YBQ0_COLTU